MTHVLALIGVLGISFSAVFVRLASVSAASATFFRGAYAVPILVVMWLAARRADSRPIRERWMAGLSGLVLALDLTLWHQAIAYIGTALATVLANVQVLFVGAVAWLLYRERPARLAFWMVPVILGGVVFISGLGQPDAYGSRPAAGVVLGVLAGLSWAWFLLMFRAANRRRVPPAGPLLDATVGTSVGAGVYGVMFDPGFSLAMTWPAHGWLLALAVVCQAAGWLLITAALPRLAALETSVMLLSQPLWTVLWGHMIFGERLSPVQWTGVGLVLLGVSALSLRGATVQAG